MQKLKLNFVSLRIVGIYFIFALLWILFSDAILAYFVVDIEMLNAVQTYKGTFFIAITSTLLYFLIKAHMTMIFHMEQKVEENEQRLEYVIQATNLGYWDWDYQSNYHIVNDTWLSFLGLSRKDIKNDITDWSSLIHHDDKVRVQSAIAKTLQDFEPYVIEFRMQHKDGHWVWIEGSGAVVEKDVKEHKALRLAGTHRDISDRKKAEEEIVFLAHNDSLTKLPNRTFLKQKFDALLEKAIKGKFAFLFLDLDAFKNINDLYGHTIGDTIIQDVAQRIFQQLTSDDVISRVGGDEFVVLTQEVVLVEHLCQKILSCMEKPFYVGEHRINLGISMGISLYPDDGDTFEELFKNADIAMYAAKNSGKNRYTFYQNFMTEELSATTTMDNAIKRGLDNDEFCLHYQPQIDLLNTGHVIGVEALVRWYSPHVGWIFPNDFIPRAEENRLIIPLGEVIFTKALKQIKSWEKDGIFNGTMAINISAIQLGEENFLDKIEAIRQDCDVCASTIELEITESFLMKDPTFASATLQKLKNIGYKISIDDFGTGYSSLAYLKQLPLHKLKIDRTFIKDLPTDKDDKAIVRAIIALARALELEVLAEGVETEEQSAFLIENWCDTAQGYLFAKPMSAEDFESFLRQN
ncbi:MAG: EAL domain-containing protein [Sulfurospirillaceae bacterium]|nr:EAL domain-containing protein [Sulfurospirillaceae bacterium]